MTALAACTTADPAAVRTLTPSPTAAASPSPTPTPTRPPSFSARRALAHIRSIVRHGPRDSVSDAYVRAGRYVAGRFRALGYEVSYQRFRVPSGTNDRIPVEAGRTFNVIARKPGVRTTRPHVVVGAHLDTTPDSPGANDNASGIAVMLELARMAAADPPRVPLIFAAFGAEERIRRGGSSSIAAEGSEEYVREMSRRQKRAVVGMLNIDMVGAGRARIMGRNSSMVRTALRAAEEADLRAIRDTTFFYSDHLSFDLVGIATVWLWTGNHPTFHKASDTVDIVRRSSLRAVGRIAWETLRRVRA